MPEDLKMRVHGDASLPTLVYLPGMHGDWTLVSSFRAAIAGRVRFVEFTYPRTTTWSLDDYARGIEGMLLERGIEHGWLLGESFGSQPAWQVVKGFLNRQRAQQGEFKKVSGQGRGPLVPEKRQAVDKALGRGRPRPILERALGAQDETRPTSSPSLEGSNRSDPLRPFPAREGGQHSDTLSEFPSWEGSGVGSSANHVGEPFGFQTQGLILAGGFVRHPVIGAVRMAGRVSRAIPMGFVKLFCVIYARYAKFRHKRAPETLASIGEFVANRTMEADRRAIVHRYALIAENDLRPVARQTHFPVFCLAGSVDPLVPWCAVRWWLRRNCPGYRGGRTLWRADHNVLGTAPGASAELIWQWMVGANAAQGTR